MKRTVTIKRNHEFQRLYAKGNQKAAPVIAMYCRSRQDGVNRLGLTVGKKVGGAVVRNKVRRRIREVYRNHELELRSGLDLVIVARVRAAFSSYEEIEQSFLKLADKLSLLEGKTES